jgi:hypothetical protein
MAQHSNGNWAGALEVAARRGSVTVLAMDVCPLKK